MDKSVLRRWELQAARTLGIFAFPLLVPIASADVNLYVSTSGKDSWSGLLVAPNATKSDGPKATLSGAQDALRNLKQSHYAPGTQYVVNVAPGTYPMRTTLTLNDGDDSSSTLYVSTVPGAAILDGSIPVSGWTVPSAAWSQRFSPKAKPYIVSVDLKKLGLTSFGSLPLAHWAGTANASTYNELYVNGARQVVARWPNVGYARVKSGSDRSGFKADLSGSRIATSDPDVQIYSFATGYDWAFQSMLVSVNVASGTVRTRPGVEISGIPQPGGRFFLRNSLEELDSPGEYYVDRTSGMMFWYPTSGYQKADVRVAANNGTVVRFQDARNTTLQGFTIRNCQGDAVDFAQGSGNSLIGCALKNIAGNGVYIHSASNIKVDSCTFNEMGEGGVRMEGACGDLATLTAGNDIVQNCQFKGLGRYVPSYRPAVLLAGVGNKASHNEISDGPHEAIQMCGNNLVAEYNKISNVCQDTVDAGAIYSWSPTAAINRGNVIRGNTITNVKNCLTPGGWGIWGIYLDNRASGFIVDSNIVKNTDTAMLMNGGRNNLFVNNIVMNCPTAFQVDDLSWSPWTDLAASLATVPYQSSLWTQSYPGLANILADDADFAKYNVFVDNVIVNSQKPLLLRSDSMITSPTVTPTDKNALGWQDIVSAPTADGLFINAAAGDFRPVPNSILASNGFRSIDASTAGISGAGVFSSSN